MIRSDGLQAAHLGVEVLETGCQAGQAPLALIGAGRHIDCSGERRFELLKASAVAPDLREFVQTAFGILDLVAGRKINGRIERDVDHVLADGNQLAPGREVVHGASVVHRIDDGRCFGGKTGEVLGEGQPRNIGLGGQKRLEGDRRGQLARADETARHVVDLLMDRLEEMRRLEKIADAIEGLVVDEDGSQKRLLRFDVVRCGTVGRRRLSR